MMSFLLKKKADLLKEMRMFIETLIYIIQSYKNPIKSYKKLIRFILSPLTD